jgi:hypothetical protein
VHGADVGFAGQVGDGAGDLDRAMHSPCAPAELERRLAQEGRCRCGQGAVRIQGGSLELGVGAALARVLRLAGACCALGHLGTAVALGQGQQLVSWQRADLHLQVDAIEQRPRQPRLVTRHLLGCAAAGATLACRCAQPTAGAGVHCGHELERCRKARLQRRARDGDVSRLQRLAQRLECAAREFGQFVEEQHTAVRQRNLTRAWWHAAAHQGGGAGRVMRRAHRPVGPARGVETAARQPLQRRAR